MLPLSRITRSNRALMLGLFVGVALAVVPAGAQPRAVAPPSADRSARPVLPPSWQESEYEVPNRRFTLEVARFPSSALAVGVRTAMEGMGWGPLEQRTIGTEEVIFLGSFSSVSYATYVARDIEAQKIATARIVEFPEGLSFKSVGIEGPLIEPFLATNKDDSRLLSSERAVRQVAMLAENLPAQIEDRARLSLERLAMESDWSAFGEDVGTLAVELARLKTDAPLAFHLAQRIATGQWSAPDPLRLACGEIVADLQYGWLRDWRGAWASTVALLEDPARDAIGRTRDRLRMAALEVELASAGSEPRPTWSRVRLQLRRAWDEVPLNADREQAKIELVYLHTHAWQGNWARVEELGKNFSARYGSRFPHEAGLAKLLLAHSMERRDAHDEALELLDGHFAGRPLPPSDGLYMGFERLDLSERYRQVRQRLAAVQLDAQAQAISERVSAIAREDEQ